MRESSYIEHPILSKFISKPSLKSPDNKNGILSKLATYECFWNWVGHCPDEKEVEVIQDRFLKGTDEEKKDKDNDDESDDEEDRKDRKKKVLKAIDDFQLPEDAFSAKEDLAFIEIGSYSRSVWVHAKKTCKKIFWLTYLERNEEALSLLDSFREELAESCEMVRTAEANGSPNTSVERAMKLDFLKYALTKPDVVEAYNYILDGLESFIWFSIGEFNKCGSLILKKPEFADMPLTKQIMLKYFKLRFYAKNRLYFLQAKESYEELAKIDPEYSRWHRCSYQFTRIARRQKSLYSVHDNNEVDLALKTYKTSPENPENISILCLNLSDILRLAVDQQHTWPFSYGDWHFASAEEVLDFIKDKARIVMGLKEYLTSIGDEEPYLNIGNIFSSVLPHKLRDLDLAEKCLDFAQQIRPNSIIARHRRALLVMKKNPIEAEMILRDFCDANGDSFYPFYDFLNILMGDFDKHQEELETLLGDNVQKTGTWSKNEISKLYFLKACLNFLKYDYKEAMQDWIQAFTFDSESKHFEGLQISVKRFSWNRRILNVSKIYQKLQNLSKIDFDKDSWQTFDVIKQNVRDLANDASKRTRSYSGGQDNSHQAFAQDHDRSGITGLESGLGSLSLGSTSRNNYRSNGDRNSPWFSRGQQEHRELTRRPSHDYQRNYGSGSLLGSAADLDDDWRRK